MAKLSFLLCLVALFSIVQISNAWRHHHVTATPAPAATPSFDCTGIIISNMMNCISYVQRGSNVSKPSGECCSGLKTILKTDAECLCEAFKSSAKFGIVVDVPKALALPSACGVKSPPLHDCGISIPPPPSGNAPVSPPKQSPSPPKPQPQPVAPVSPSPRSVQPQGLAPAPSPAKSGASAISISSFTLVVMVSLMVASLAKF